MVVVGEDCNGAFILRTILEGTQCLAHGCVGLAVGVILGVVNDKSCIYGGRFGYAVHGEGDVRVLFFLLTLHFVVTVQFCLYILHHTAQGAGLRQVNVSRLSSLHFGDFIAHTACLACQNGIGYTAPNAHEFG